MEEGTLTQLAGLGLLTNKGAFEWHVDERPTDANEEGKKYVLVPNMILRAGLILKSGHLSDVMFVVGESWARLEAHKLILAGASDVFQAMFYGSLPESFVVRIPHTHPKAFYAMLQFIYMGVVPKVIDTEIGLHCLDLARKYFLIPFEVNIAFALLNGMTEDNVLRILEAFDLFGLTQVEENCWIYVDLNVATIMKTESFKEITMKTLCRILTRDDLRATELELFEGVQVWGRAECERRGQPPYTQTLYRLLRPCLLLLRFPTLTAAEYANGPGRSGLLDSHDNGEILLYICSSNACKPYCRWRTTLRPFNDPARRPPPLMCDCHSSNPSCFFCFGRTQVKAALGERASGMCAPERPAWGRGTPRPLYQPPRSSTSRRTPPAYCRCRSRGVCPVKETTRGYQGTPRPTLLVSFLANWPE